jgi:hypothetical protein
MNVKVLTSALLFIGAVSAIPATAQEVITNPGWCAQFYPNANCQNLGPGNPYRGPDTYQARQSWRQGYAMAPQHYRHHRHHWR